MQLKIHQLKVNSGSGLTRNIEINLAKGTHLAFLDRDDLCAIEILSLHAGFMIEMNEAFICASFGFR